MPVSSALRRMRQVDLEFETSLGYISVMLIDDR
jgi:hypothetical protein